VLRYMKKAAGLLFAAAMCLIFTGCLSVTADELYQLPKASEGYVRIQQKISEIQSGGAEYAAPVSGYFRQAIQLRDIDGDGTEEAVAFFRTKGDKPLKIYLLKETENSYEIAAAIEGDGTAVDSVSYVDMNGDGCCEIIVGWQMSSSVKMMGIYSIKDYQPVQLATCGYSAYTSTDMDGDGTDEVIALQTGTVDSPGSAVMYMLMDDGEVVNYQAALSASAESISRTQTGLLADRKNGVFVDSVCGSGLVTDVLAFTHNELVNVTLESETQCSVAERPYTVYSTDINSDGFIEIPEPVALYPQSETTYYAIKWNTCTSRGFISAKLTTYHNYSDGWYLIIPEEWTESVTIRREDGISGERAVVFSKVITPGDEDTDPVIEDFLKIYSLTGDNKEDKADTEGRFILRRESEKIYAASLMDSTDDTVTEQYIRDNFRIIHSDWLSGTI
jgi:hypothetical protein